MSSLKELLRQMIERMSDAEARQLLEFAQHLRHKRDDSLTLKRLATNPAFKVPGSGARDFYVVAPNDAFVSAARRLTPASSSRVVNPVVYALEVLQ
jgi:hypothetical protein